MKRRRPRALRGQSINRLIPNILTLLALCAGVTAIRYALDEAWGRAVIAVVVAAVLDALDGRIARALGATSRFGAELDSLSDFICFGVAPALVVYLWSLDQAGGLGWALTLLFAVCCALRLARFNTGLDSGDVRPAWAQNFFVGVPAPAGGGLALLPLILGLQFETSEFFSSPVLNGLTMLVVSVLMVSRVPTFAFKKIQVPGRHVIPTLLAAGACFAFLISTPWITLATVGLVYAASIPYAVKIYRRRERTRPPIPEEGIDDEDEDEDTEA